MTTVNPSLLRLFYDPVGWADPAWQARFGIDARWTRRLSNDLLLRRARVGALSRADAAHPGAAWLASNWDALPAGVYLAGARLARNTVLGENALLRLRYEARRFLMLPQAQAFGRGTPPPVADLAAKPPQSIHARVMAAGVHCLWEAWPALTPGWRDRIRLRLPPEADAASGGELGALPLSSAGCLRLLNHALTFHHAQNP